MALASSPHPLVIDGVQIIDGSGVPAIPEGRIVVLDDLIDAMGPKDTVQMPEGAEVVLGAGHTVLPGLIDLHVHGSKPWGGGDKTTRTKDPDMALYVKNGVTSIRYLGGSIREHLGLRSRIESHQIPGPRVFSVGPMLHPTPHAWAAIDSATADSPIEARRVVRRLVQEDRVDAILATQGITPATLRIIVQTAHELGVPVTGQIWRCSARDAVAAGMDGLENSSRFPESPAWPLERVMSYTSVLERVSMRAHLWAEADWGATIEVAHMMAESGMFLSPTHVWIGPWDSKIDTFLTKHPDWIEYARPETQSDGGLSAEYAKRPWSQEDFRANIKADERFREFCGIFHKAGGYLVTATDDMKGLGGMLIHREMEIFQEIGLSPLQVIRAATRQAASALGRDDLGLLYPGNKADLIVVEGDPSTNLRALRNVRYAFVGGYAMVREGVLQKHEASDVS